VSLEKTTILRLQLSRCAGASEERLQLGGSTSQMQPVQLPESSSGASKLPAVHFFGLMAYFA